MLRSSTCPSGSSHGRHRLRPGQEGRTSRCPPGRSRLLPPGSRLMGSWGHRRVAALAQGRVRVERCNCMAIYADCRSLQIFQPEGFGHLPERGDGALYAAALSARCPGRGLGRTTGAPTARRPAVLLSLPAAGRSTEHPGGTGQGVSPGHHLAATHVSNSSGGAISCKQGPPPAPASKPWGAAALFISNIRGGSAPNVHRLKVAEKTPPPLQSLAVIWSASMAIRA